MLGWLWEASLDFGFDLGDIDKPSGVVVSTSNFKDSMEQSQEGHWATLKVNTQIMYKGLHKKLGTVSSQGHFTF